MGDGSIPVAGKFDSLEIPNEIAVPADHMRRFLLSGVVQSRQQPCPDSDGQRRLWMAFG
jgi:hypothetical protein